MSIQIAVGLGVGLGVRVAVGVIGSKRKCAWVLVDCEYCVHL